MAPAAQRDGDVTAPTRAPEPPVDEAASAPADETAPPMDAEADDDALGPAAMSLEEAALMAELNAELGDQGASPALELYGFADFSFYKFFVDEGSLLGAHVYPKSSFAVGNLNLYLSSNLSRKWRALSEVRYTFLPNGARFPEGQALRRVDTTAPDYVNFGGQRRTGSIVIERAWLEHRFDALLNVRLGKWLTPYGIWNVDHGSPAIIPVVRPYIIALDVIPESQTGVQLYGRHAVTEQLTVGYSLSLSNGRGPVEDYADLDENKALTARVGATHRGLGVLDVGGTVYYGRFTNESQNIVPRGTGFGLQNRIVSQYDELAWGLDVRWTLGGFHAQAEFLTTDGRYTRAGRELRTAEDFQPDRHSSGGYALLGYRFDWQSLMPFAMWEYIEAVNLEEIFRPVTLDEIIGGALGINARPTPTVTLKAAIYGGIFPGGSRGSAYESSPWVVQSQAAWAF